MKEKFLIIEIIMMVMIVIVAIIHKDWFAANKPVGFWFHIGWAIPFSAFIAVVFFVTHNYLLTAALILQRFDFFNPILNLLRKEYLFYLGSATMTEAWLDRLLEIYNNSYPYIWAAGCLAFTYLEIKLFV